jgi:lipoate-protein ligase A
LLDLDEDKLFSLFKYPNERVKERMQKSFKNKAVAMNQLTSETITLDQAKRAFKKGFEEGLNIELEPYELTAEEIAYVQKIAKERYENDKWNFKR